MTQIIEVCISIGFITMTIVLIVWAYTTIREMINYG